MGDARSEVTGGVDGVTGGSAQRDANAHDEQRYRQRAEARGGAAESKDDENEDESADDLGYEVPWGGADGGAGGEGSEFAGGFRFVIEVLLVRQPADDRAEEGPQQFAAEVGHG